MTAGKVSGLVGKDANDFVWGLGVKQRSRIDEDMPAIHHERVERAVAQDHHPHILFCKSRRSQDRLCIVAQQLLDLGVTNDRHPARRTVLSVCGCDASGADGDRREQGDRPGCWRPAPRPDRCAVQGHADVHRMRVKLLTPLQAVNAACDHDPVMTALVASKPGNAAAAGQGNKAQSAKNDA